MTITVLIGPQSIEISSLSMTNRDFNETLTVDCHCAITVESFQTFTQAG